MNKALLILLFSTLTLSGYCGAKKTFDCGLFSFEYPSYYSNNPIQESPHMVLKSLQMIHISLRPTGTMI